MKFTMLALMILLGTTACHRQGKPTPTAPAFVNHGSYAYHRVNDTQVVMMAVTGEDRQAALKEIGCGSKYVCAVEQRANLYYVELHPKGGKP